MLQIFIKHYNYHHHHSHHHSHHSTSSIRLTERSRSALIALLILIVENYHSHNKRNPPSKVTNETEGQTVKLDAWKFLLNWDDVWGCCSRVADDDDDDAWFATFDDIDADFEIVVFFKVVNEDDDGEFTKNGFGLFLFIFTFIYSFKWLSWKINDNIDVFCIPDTRPIERKRPLIKKINELIWKQIKFS